MNLGVLLIFVGIIGFHLKITSSMGTSCIESLHNKQINYRVESFLLGYINWLKKQSLKFENNQAECLYRNKKSPICEVAEVLQKWNTKNSPHKLEHRLIRELTPEDKSKLKWDDKDNQNFTEVSVHKNYRYYIYIDCSYGDPLYLQFRGISVTVS